MNYFLFQTTLLLLSILASSRLRRDTFGNSIRHYAKCFIICNKPSIYIFLPQRAQRNIANNTKPLLNFANNLAFFAVFFLLIKSKYFLQNNFHIAHHPYLILHTSYFIPHTSYFIPHTSYLLVSKNSLFMPITFPTPDLK